MAVLINFARGRTITGGTGIGVGGQKFWYAGNSNVILRVGAGKGFGHSVILNGG
jgi:hypothetical protein